MTLEIDVNNFVCSPKRIEILIEHVIQLIRSIMNYWSIPMIGVSYSVNISWMLMRFWEPSFPFFERGKDWLCINKKVGSKQSLARQIVNNQYSRCMYNWRAKWWNCFNGNTLIPRYPIRNYIVQGISIYC